MAIGQDSRTSKSAQGEANHRGVETSVDWRGFARRLGARSYILLLLILVMVVGGMLSPFFFTGRNIQNILVTGSTVSVLAIGQFAVIVTAGIDLSVGAILALGTVVTALLLEHGQNTMVAIVVCLALSAVVGLLNGALVVYARITPFIATLGTMTLLTGVAYIVQSGTQINITDQDFLDTIAGDTFGVSNLILIFLVVTIISALVAQFTPYGRQLYAIGGNAEAARLSGIAVKRDLLLAYAFSGLMAGLAGVMLAAELQQGSSLVGQGDELTAIAAAVVGGASLFGGTGSPITSVAGGFVIGIITNIMTLMGIASQPQLITQGLVILIAVYLTSGDGPRIIAAIGGRIPRRTRISGAVSAATPDASKSAAPEAVDRLREP